MDDFPKVPDSVLLIVSETIARENCVLPFEVTGDVLSLYYPADLDAVGSLEDHMRFIFERPIKLVPLLRSTIREQIEIHYSRTSPYEVLPPIENCEPWFRYECPKKWHSLTPTADEGVRHCPECDQMVFSYRSRAELQSLRGKRCVFLDSCDFLGEVDC